MLNALKSFGQQLTPLLLRWRKVNKYSLSQQMVALREMQSMAQECEYVARVVLKKPDLLRQVNALQADLERGSGLITGLQVGAALQPPIAGVN
jgi:hypothetical protein